MNPYKVQLNCKLNFTSYFKCFHLSLFLGCGNLSLAKNKHKHWKWFHRFEAQAQLKKATLRKRGGFEAWATVLDSKFQFSVLMKLPTENRRHWLTKASQAEKQLCRAAGKNGKLDSLWNAGFHICVCTERSISFSEQLHNPRSRPLPWAIWRTETSVGVSECRTIWKCRSKAQPLQAAVTLKMNLFINTVVYLEMCSRGVGGVKKKSNLSRNK